ncbi:MAG TPA: methyltransferase MtaB domain-containing protein [Kiritimatiellia bacterium]|nr:methyltransferase MtaB domain-containing protein [Kiritimatiellia bacterium]HRU69856.1 methyltransferase MtaB domain-containing protein [Kiritimatiellia bacterium]
MQKYSRLAIPNPSDLIFGRAPRPVRTRSGMVIGGGDVYPELNFTLPPMEINAANWPEIRRQYREIITGATQRAAELGAPGLVVEFETMPPMCECPEWALELTRILLDGLAEAEADRGLKGVLRMTPNDLREMSRPPLMRRGHFFEKMMATFEGAAAAGAELLSIESTGGKEVCDEALTFCNLPQVIFALCVLGVRDMRFLWTELQKIADRHGVLCAGDTACGFGNTAMVLAEKRYIPRVFAAVVRAVSAVRTLVGYECGCVGPGKDCGYENIYLKAITGCPMAMEGKASACAHLSPLGNIAGAVCDTWSNESVQNVKLLAAMAPTCYAEQLIYDCRLFNTATRHGHSAACTLRDWMVESDAPSDPQAWVLRPDIAVAIAQSIVDAPDHYAAGLGAAAAALKSLRAAHAAGALRIDEREIQWLDTMDEALAALPRDESRFIDQMLAEVDTSKFVLSEYGL